MDVVDQQAPLPPTPHGARRQDLAAAAAFDTAQQRRHHAGGGGALHPARLADGQHRRVGIEHVLGARARVGIRQAELRRRDHQAGQQAHQVHRQRRDHRVVEVVQIKIHQAVVTLEAAHVLQVEVAADIGGGCLHQRGLGAHRGRVEVVGAAQEGERIGGDGRELARQPLGIAAMVIDQDGFRSWVHGFLIVAGNRSSVPG